MEKVLFRKPDFDTRLNMTRPAFLPINWYELWEQQKYLKINTRSNELLFNNNTQVNSSDFIQGIIKYWEYDFFNDHVEYIEKYDGRKYFYYIPLHLVDYFEQLEHIGFSGLEEEVKKDIRDSKCKIILLATDEGYFGEDADLYSCRNWDLELIQKWCEKEKFPPDSVSFICMNMIGEEHCSKKGLSYNIITTSWMSENHLKLNKNKSIETSNYLELNPNSKLFVTYNKAFHFHRLALLDSLNKKNLFDVSYHSFDLQKSNTDLFDSQLNIFKKFNEGLLSDNFDDLIASLPILIENDEDKNKYSRYDFYGQIMIDYHYENSFMSVVTETLYKSGTVYFSEKTFKPIYQCQPFLLVSSKGSLKKLKDLGYQTFDRWWDESYDECDDYIERVDKITDILVKLKSKSFDELKTMKQEMKSLLIDNYNNFIHRNTQRPSPIVDRLKHEYKKLNNE